VGALDQQLSRSRREIEAHATELVDYETGRHFITLTAELLAHSGCGPSVSTADQAVRELLAAVDPVRLGEISAELQAASDAEATATAITGMA
jgi:hypothetical protein